VFPFVIEGKAHACECGERGYVLACIARSGYTKCRFVTPSVPDVENLDAEGLLADVVEDAVGAKDDLAQGSSRAARIGGANKWKGSQNANVVEYAPPEP
jgi:hypothetical protein